MAHFIENGMISRDQGKVFWLGKRLIIPLYHPAAALRRTEVLDELQKSFVRLSKALKQYDKLLAKRSQV